MKNSRTLTLHVHHNILSIIIAFHFNIAFGICVAAAATHRRSKRILTIFKRTLTALQLWMVDAPLQ